MSRTALALGLLLCGTFGGTAHAAADPYRWCAQYAGRDGSQNCYFLTLEQCRGALDGASAFCRPNTFYTGPAVEREGRRVHRSSRS